MVDGFTVGGTAVPDTVVVIVLGMVTVCVSGGKDDFFETTTLDVSVGGGTDLVGLITVGVVTGGVETAVLVTGFGGSVSDLAVNLVPVVLTTDDDSYSVGIGMVHEGVDVVDGGGCVVGDGGGG